MDGLWSRDTPFGANGYFIDLGFDGVPLSHHILTTDGILGRDTLGPGLPMPPLARKAWSAADFRRSIGAPDPPAMGLERRRP